MIARYGLPPSMKPCRTAVSFIAASTAAIVAPVC